jgi:hypothetical protein
MAFLRRFCQIASGFHFFGFRNKRASSSALRAAPNLEDQVSIFISPTDRVAQLHPQAPGSLSVAFHDSQGYGGGILTHLHTGTNLCIPLRNVFQFVFIAPILYLGSHSRNLLTGEFTAGVESVLVAEPIEQTISFSVLLSHSDIQEFCLV